MFDHVTIRVADREASERFYRTVLGALGIAPTYSGQELVEWDDFSIAGADEARPPTRHLHIGFCAESHDDVDAFWRAGVDAGYRDDGEPGARPQYGGDYYGGFLLDPDGNSAEATHHGDTRRGGHIDHVWIGVREIDEGERFYDAIARYTGLRKGSRSDVRRQYCGAWATFSLMADGRRPTEGLHLAFPAPDRRTVEEFHRAAVRASYRDNGAPGERAIYHAAYVLDPDGTNVESVFHDRR